MTEIMTVGSNENRAGHNLVEYSTTFISASIAGVAPTSDTVKVIILYPDKYKKQKYFKNGDVKEVSKEVAEQFIGMGIASLLTNEQSTNKGEETPLL
jgi:hypothetical protein